MIKTMIEKMLKDGSGLRRTTIDEMICKDCKHRIPQSETVCKKFKLKTQAVFKGNCPEYEKE